MLDPINRRDRSVESNRRVRSVQHVYYQIFPVQQYRPKARGINEFEFISVYIVAHESSKYFPIVGIIGKSFAVRGISS
jgi:hypothetical protein